MANAWEMVTLSEFTAPEMLASKSQMDVHNSPCARDRGGDGDRSIHESKGNE